MRRRDFFGVLGKILGGAILAPLLPELLAQEIPVVVPKGWILRVCVSDAAEFSFGFTGFVPLHRYIVANGQILWKGDVRVRAPRLSRPLYGIQG